MTDTTNGQTQNPDEIERDIERTRADMQDTLDALQRKLSPGQLVDQALDYVRQGPGDFFDTLGATVRHNPVPVALLGISLGWLMLAGPRRPPEAEAEARALDEEAYRGDTEAPRDYRGFRDYDELVHPGAFEDRHYTVEASSAGTARTTGGARAYAAAHDQAGGGSGYTEYAGRSEHADTGPSTLERLGAKAGELAQDARDRVADLASGVRERFGGRSQSYRTGEWASDKARGARETVSGMAQSAQDTMNRAADTVSRTAQGAVEQVSRAADTARHYGRRTGEQAGRVGQGFSDMVENNPLLLGAVGLAIGAAIGYALPSTRREDELLGPRRDDLLSRARQAGEEGLHKAQEVGARVYETAKEEVRKQTGMADQEESSGRATAPAEERSSAGGQSGTDTAGTASASGGGEPSSGPGGDEAARATASRSKRAGSAPT